MMKLEKVFDMAIDALEKQAKPLVTYHNRYYMSRHLWPELKSKFNKYLDIQEAISVLKDMKESEICQKCIRSANDKGTDSREYGAGCLVRDQWQES